MVPAPLVALFRGRLEVGLYLGLKRLGEHLLGSAASDLVKVEHELLTSGSVLLYAVHRCVLHADVALLVLPLGWPKGRYTTSLGKSSIHNFRSYLSQR